VAGIPTVTVEMDNPEGSNGWIDVTSYVSMENGIRCSRGRSSEFETSAPGTASFTVSNTDGSWSPGNFFSDAVYGLMRKNARVRFTVAGLQVWQGRVDTLRVTPGDVMGLPRIEIACTDEFKTYSKAQLAPYGIETIKAELTWLSGAVYPLTGGAARSSSFAAHRDPSASPMKLTWDGYTDWMRYELTTDGPPFVKSAIKLKPKGQVGPVLEHPTTWDPGSEHGLVSFWFRTTADETSYLFSMERTSGGAGYASIFINATTGRLTFVCAGDSGGSASVTPSGGVWNDLFDGAWHHVACWFSTGTGTTIRPILDGEVWGGTVNSGGTACTIGSSNRRAVFGGNRNSAWNANTFVFNGDIAAPAIFTDNFTYTAGPDQWYDDGATGNDDQSVASRATELAAFIGASTPSTANLSGYNIAGMDTDGMAYLDAVQALASTELGVFYMDRLGNPKLRGFGARSSGSSVTLTVSALADLADNCELVLDDATYANTVAATSPNASATVVDSSRVTADGASIVDEWSALTYSATDLSTMATNRLNLRKSNTFRLGRITVDLLTAQNAIESTTLQLVPIDRVRVSDLDSTMFGATTYDGFVEGWELTVSLDEYSVALDLSPVI
jgi:hypothetical protein